VTAPLSGVGRNLQDHLQAQLVYRCLQPISLNDDLNSLWRKARMGIRYLVARSGPLAGGPAPAGAFAKSQSNLTRPDLQFHFMPLSMARPGVIDRFSGFSFNACQLRPRSRGDVLIRSSDPIAPPAINANYLSEEADGRVLVAGLKLGRRIADSTAFDTLRGTEERPGADAINDAELLHYARQAASSLYHPVGTCQMGQGPNAVVDASLKVHGLAGLRVADASIMPTLISGNINAATIMIAEKAADLISADAVSSGR
jgi:choline dehydrogenase